MPLQTGTWTMNVGGQVTQMTIGNDANGKVAVQIIGANPLSALWDEDSQRLILSSSEGQLFVGYFFTDTVNLTGVKGAALFTLVGTVENYVQGRIIGPLSTAKRSTFGWYAQIGVD